METTTTMTREQVDELADAIAVSAARIDAATHTLLTHVRAFDQARGWARQGARSCAHWLSWRIGCGLGAAGEKVRVANALGDLPLIDAALREGKLSYCKVRAMTRVATPDNEALLLEQSRRCRCAGESATRALRPQTPDRRRHGPHRHAASPRRG
jgi:hypothetical protein